MNKREYIISLHNDIHQNILGMIPEKFKKVCLYASVVDEKKDVTGEMFFYYFPKGIMKRKPINVYEIPELFNIDEEAYQKLEKKLYESIKKISRYHKNKQKQPWTNLTIIIEGTKYRVEFNYNELLKSEFSDYERHIIWRYEYLGISEASYNREERKILDKYFSSNEYYNSKNLVFEYNFYEKPTNTLMQFNFEGNEIEKPEEVLKEKEEKPKTIYIPPKVEKKMVTNNIETEKKKKEKNKTQIKNKNEKEKQQEVAEQEETTEKVVRNQLLNY